MGLLGLLVFALLLPAQANQLARSVLGEAVTINNQTGISDTTNTLSITIANLLTSKQADQTVAISKKDTSPFSDANIIDATNAERVKVGLQPLKTNDKLAASAKVKVEDMIKNQYFEHTSPTGKTVADLGSEVGYNYVVMGENLALGDFADVHDLLTAWMNSPGHRANILNTSYEDMGAYAAQGMYQGHLVWFAVQHFGTERGVCPSINEQLKGSIDALNAKITNENTIITTLRAQIEDPSHVQGTAYSAQITEFNALVAKYNIDLTTSQGEIADYNKQVAAFNKCLSQYQVSIPQ